MYFSINSRVVLLIFTSWTYFRSLYKTIDFATFIIMPTSFLAASNSFSSCCNSLGLLAVKTISSANFRWFRYSPTIDRCLLFQSSVRNLIFLCCREGLGGYRVSSFGSWKFRSIVTYLYPSFSCLLYIGQGSNIRFSNSC